MRVALISSKYMSEYSGSGLRAHNTYKRLKQKFGIEFQVLCNSVEYGDDLDYTYDGVKVKRLARRYSRADGRNSLSAKVMSNFCDLADYVSIGRRTVEFLNKGQFDFIHTLGSSVSVNVALYYAHYRKVPFLREICNQGTQADPSLPFKLQRLIGSPISRLGRVVSISPSISDFLLSRGTGKDLIWERPNPIDQSRFKPYGDIIKFSNRKKLTSFSETDLIILNNSQFIPRKNHILLVEALKYLPDKFKLVLIGPKVKTGLFAERDNQYFQDILTTIKRHGLESRVFLQTGFFSQIEDFYALADVFAFPSISDGYGTPQIEALACGIPVVATRLPGVTDWWVKDGKNGYICGFEAEEFARFIERASQIEPQQRRRASQEVLQMASTSAIDSEYYDLIRSLSDVRSCRRK